ncbi:tripartite tricarboxylate transporter permease [Candidatus Woesearchaeota archaeon]|nr:tripartite tricarboxylate transporter permease [Candidatus Woesearchaeota archaeon]
MFTAIIAALLVGILFGTITGLIPGVHVNLISIILLSLTGYLLGFTSPLVLAVFIISMSITHTFLDSIPSIFLGAPDADTALAVLPGHRLLLKGKGYEAVKLTVIGSLLCLIFTVAIIPALIPIAPLIYATVKPVMGWILLVVVLFMILKEATWKKRFWAFAVFSISGILGLIVLNLNNLEQPLFPLLSGLFGLSILVMSLQTKTVLPKQEITEDIHVSAKDTTKAVAAGTFSGTLTGLFPGLGAAQAAIIGTQLTGDIGNNGFMILVGGVNTVNFVFSLVTLYTLQKARNGAVIAVMEILKSISIAELIVFISVALIVGGIATLLALRITRIFAKVINKINYQKLIIGIIILIIVLVFIFSKPLGMLVLLISTAAGLVPALTNVGKNHAMGCLLLPVMLFFLI